MSESQDALDAFREEARSWLAENFPAAIRGRASEFVSMESVDDSNADFRAWCDRLGQKG